jgi:glycosyltransferase involved in cell wall biosynthesis
LNKARFRVFLGCLSGTGGPLVPSLRQGEVKLIFLKFRLRYLPVSLGKLVFCLRKENVQIVHTHGFTAGVWGRLAAWVAGVPVIIAHEHGKTLWKKRRHLLFERCANRFTHLRIAVSRDILQRRMKLERTPADKMIVLPNGVDLNQFPPADPNPIKCQLGLQSFGFVIGTVGRLVDAKAYHVLIDAFALAQPKIDNSCLLFMGDGPLRSFLENYVREKKLTAVWFLGAREDIPRLLSVLNVFVLSSIREGLPVSLLEAMAAKVPVVAAAVGGISEVVVDRKNGFLVPPNSVEKLAEKIIELSENQKLREEFASAAFETIRQGYSIQKTTAAIEQIYNRLAIKKNLSEHTHAPV